MAPTMSHNILISSLGLLWNFLSSSYCFFCNSIGLSKSQPANTEREKNVLENKKLFLFAEKVAINISERGMKFGGEGRGI